jgi:HPt (histidine-containing phosphotransfer) domain-containing protein
MAELTATAAAGTAAAPEVPFDEAALRERVEGDTELLREIIELFLEDSPRLIDEVRAAVAAGDAAALRRAAHTLKGAASNFGASAVVAAALELETMGRTGDLSGAAPARDRLGAALAALDAALAALAESAA